MADDNSIPIDVVELRCHGCGALTAFNCERFEPASARCLQCWLPFQKAVAHTPHSVNWPNAPLGRALRRARLRWYAGYISEYSRAIEDAQAVMVSVDMTAVIVHEDSGRIYRFHRSGGQDSEGFDVFDEVPWERQVPFAPPPASRPRVSPNEIFDYSVRLPAAGHDARCAPRDASQLVHLVGASPLLRLESVGMLRGGGRLSRVIPDISRPAVRGTLVNLIAVERGEHASTASFLLDEELVNVFREGDELNLTRTHRGGLAVSVRRNGGLLVALGAVSAAPLGPDLNVVVRRDRLSKDPPCDGFTDGNLPWLHPLEITSGEPPRRPRGFTIRVWSRAWPPPEDADECVTIIRTGGCPDTAAFASTHLLAMDEALRVT